MEQVTLCRIDALPEQGARGFDPLGRGHDTVFKRARAILFLSVQL